MRWWIVATLTVAAGVGLGFVHPFGNPRVESEKGLDTLLQNSEIPADARAILAAKCSDCHSNETRWPVYSRIAPGSWLIERDIVEGRRHINLSNWRQTTADGQAVLMAKIAQQARSGAMPPVQYLALHWNARLSAAEIQTLAKLSGATGKGGADEGNTEAAHIGDPEHGKIIFQKRCTGCHALNADRDGPRLAGVVGREAGSVPGFAYSSGLKNLGVTWTDANLEKWLSDPDLMVPDNNMSFRVPKADERRDLIAFLRK